MTANTKNDLNKSASWEEKKILGKIRDTDKEGERKDTGHFSSCSSITESLSIW